MASTVPPHLCLSCLDLWLLPAFVWGPWVVLWVGQFERTWWAQVTCCTLQACSVSSSSSGSFYRIHVVTSVHFLTSISTFQKRAESGDKSKNVSRAGINKRRLHLFFYIKKIFHITWLVKKRLSSVTQSCLTLCNPMDSSTPSFTNSCSLIKLMAIESVMPSKHLILCHPLLLLPSIFPASRSFQMS